MPDATIQHTPAGWPYLDENNYIDVIDDYTYELAGLLQGSADDVAGAIANAAAAQAAATAAQTAAGSAGSVAAAVQAAQTAAATREYWGPGRPDVAASMDQPGKDWVAAASAGAVFHSTNGPQGAWTWQKRGSTWTVVDGDTGLIDLAAAAAWPASHFDLTQAKALLIRRVNNSVQIIFKASLVSSHPTVYTSTLFPAGTVPSGFRPSHNDGALIYLDWVNIGYLLSVQTGGNIEWAARSVFSSLSIRGVASYLTPNAWPTTLTI